jgi:hypothetical protein
VPGSKNRGEDDVDEASVDKASATLDEGLKSCRAVVENYRAMLGADPTDSGDSAESPTPLNDNPE